MKQSRILIIEDDKLACEKFTDIISITFIISHSTFQKWNAFFV